MSEKFSLHPRLVEDTLPVLELELSTALLKDDSRWPWLILVPRVAKLREMHHLPHSQRSQLMEEMALASRVLESVCMAGKINVGALGNHVPQLHVHVVARHAGDPAWPGPVWGFGEPVPYIKSEGDELVRQMADAFRE